MELTFLQHTLILANITLFAILALLLYFKDDRGILCQAIAAGLVSLFLPAAGFRIAPGRAIRETELRRWRRTAADVGRLTGRKPRLLIDQGPDGLCVVALEIGRG